MFKSQGLFSSLPCLSTPCTSQHCLFSHQPISTSQSVLESPVPATINSPDRVSPPDDGRSRKKRRIERSASSHDSKTTTDDPGETSPTQVPSITSTNMLEVLPRDLHRYHHDYRYKFPAFDVKRKYTETFNLAAKEFIPAKEQGPKAPTPISDPGIHPSINAN